MTMARILLSHTDALVGYKYCNGVDNNHPEEDVWVAHRWIADLKTHTQHRVLPKRLAEPINRLIAVVSDLHRNHVAASQET
jgi:alpha-D-ribose 1-methylphosphonate 5-triphosphate synthase subunit PhnG